MQQAIAERLDSIPPRDEMKDSIRTVFDNLPDHDYVDAVEEHLGEQIDMIPSNQEIIDSLDSAFDSIPKDDYFHSKVDELVDS